MKRSKGFTLVELLVVVAIIALLVSILVPTLARARETTRRALCQANLNGLGKGLEMYKADFNDTFPCLSANANVSTTGLSITGNPATNTDITALAGTFPQDNLSLLVSRGNVPWKMFLCPSTGNKEKDRSLAADKYGFGKGTNAVNTQLSYVDYALHAPWRYLAANTENKAWLGSGTDSSIIVMADRPDTADFVAKFSPNHADEGEALLAYGGNVRWSDDKTSTSVKNTGGWGNNNIYVVDMTAADALGTAANSAPTNAAIPSKYDSVCIWRQNP